MVGICVIFRIKSPGMESSVEVDSQNLHFTEYHTLEFIYITK